MDNRVAHASRRKGEISAQNVMYCLFVLAIHLLTPELLSHTGIFLLQRLLFCAIFGFIFLAGLKSTLNSGKKSLLQYYKGRFSRVVLPYLVAVALYMCIYRALGIAPVDSLDLTDYIRYALCGNLTAHLYFVIALLQLYLVTPVIAFLCRRCTAVRVLAVSLAATLCTALFFHSFSFYNRLFTRYFFCYVCGCCAGLNYECFADRLRRYRAVITSVFAPLCVTELVLAALYRRALIPSVIQQVFTMLYMPSAVLFVCCVFVCANKADDTRRPKRIFTLLDRESYFIYLYHILALQLADRLLAKLSPTLLGDVSYFAARCVLCLAILSAMLALKLIFMQLRQRVLSKKNEKKE